MKSQTYEEIVQMLQTAGPHDYVMDFEEYTLIGGKPFLALEIEDAPVISHIKEQEPLSMDEIHDLYGGDATVSICHVHPYVRLIIEAGDDNAVIHLNRTYFTSGLQKLRLKRRETTTGGVKPWLGAV